MKNIRQHIREFLLDKINPTVFELGVHWGEDTKNILNWCQGTANYHGFEPDKRNLKKISEEWENTMPKNLTIIEGAISDKEGSTTLYLSDGIHSLNGLRMTGANSIRKPYEVLKKHSWIDFSQTTTVKTYTIDTYCKNQNINKIDFIWSDIQGCEYDMLLGAKEMLPNIGIMLLEYSEIELYKGQGSLKDMLNLLGNDWELIGKDSWDIIVRNKKYNND
jgi:FkbM family methyltransferase